MTGMEVPTQSLPQRMMKLAGWKRGGVASVAARTSPQP